MKIFIVDNHRITMDGIASLLQKNKNFKVVGTAACQETALSCLKENSTDLLLIDANLRNSDGVNFIKKVKERKLLKKVVVLSELNEVKKIKDLFKIGIDGYIEKTEGFSELLTALEKVKKGEVYLGDSLKDKLVNSFTSTVKKADKSCEELFSTLTAREIEVLNLICEGYSSKEISEELFISINTVETHRQHILQKLNVKSSLSLVKFAMENYFVS